MAADSAQRDALTRAGHRRRTRGGEVLFAAGQRECEFHLLLSGTVEIVADSADGPRPVRVHQPGELTGDIDGFLTGRAAVVTATVRAPGEIVVLDRHQLRALLADVPELCDTILQAFLSRRRIELDGARAARRSSARAFPPTRCASATVLPPRATGPAGPARPPARAGRRARRHHVPLPSVRGVFAVGDVRSGSVKRVASAVGEGAMAVSLAHCYLDDG